MSYRNPEAYVQLPVTNPEDESARYRATAPQRWANLLIEAALQSGQEPHLLERVRLGNVAVNVLFAPEDWVAHTHHFRSSVTAGWLRVVDKSLEVGQATPSPNSQKALFTFSRSDKTAPYTPEQAQYGDQPLVQFPPGVTADEVPVIYDALRWMGVGVDLVKNDLEAPSNTIRRTPYVRITNP